MHSEQVVERIKLSQLLNRLQDNALGLLKSPSGDHYWLTDGERLSIIWLLERKLAKAEAPKSVHLTGELTLKALIDGTQRAPG